MLWLSVLVRQIAFYFGCSFLWKFISQIFFGIKITIFFCFYSVSHICTWRSIPWQASIGSFLSTQTETNSIWPNLKPNQTARPSATWKCIPRLDQISVFWIQNSPQFTLVSGKIHSKGGYFRYVVNYLNFYSDLGSNHLLFWWQISVKTWTDFLHLAGALMEHFLEGIAPLRYWYINPNEQSNKYKSSLLS